jgi:hypothetical protein
MVLKVSAGRSVWTMTAIFSLTYRTFAWGQSLCAIGVAIKDLGEPVHGDMENGKSPIFWTKKSTFSLKLVQVEG